MLLKEGSAFLFLNLYLKSSILVFPIWVLPIPTGLRNPNFRENITPCNFIKIVFIVNISVSVH